MGGVVISEEKKQKHEELEVTELELSNLIDHGRMNPRHKDLTNRTKSMMNNNPSRTDKYRSDQLCKQTMPNIKMYSYMQAIEQLSTSLKKLKHTNKRSSVNRSVIGKLTADDLEPYKDPAALQRGRYSQQVETDDQKHNQNRDQLMS